jgi:nucleotide-binding universal stress UspA family protein
MTTVLVATDGSPHSEAAAKRLFAGARFVVVTVAHSVRASTTYPYPVIPLAVGPYPVETSEDLEAHIRETAERVVAGTASIFDGEAEAVVDWGPTARTICDRARTIGADVIVLGDHGHGWLGDRLIGSVARAVTHHAPCGIYVHRDRVEDPDSADAPAHDESGGDR